MVASSSVANYRDTLPAATVMQRNKALVDSTPPTGLSALRHSIALWGDSTIGARPRSTPPVSPSLTDILERSQNVLATFDPEDDLLVSLLSSLPHKGGAMGASMQGYDCGQHVSHVMVDEEYHAGNRSDGNDDINSDTDLAMVAADDNYTHMSMPAVAMPSMIVVPFCLKQQQEHQQQTTYTNPFFGSTVLGNVGMEHSLPHVELSVPTTRGTNGYSEHQQLVVPPQHPFFAAMSSEPLQSNF
ncbi:hypothetical protein ACA910_002539 [Epithemia clementina (nom. ined.)]